VQELALDMLGAAGLHGLMLDLADARLVRGVLSGVSVDGAALENVVAALAAKDGAALQELTRGFPAASRDALMNLLKLYGDESVLERARALLPERPLIRRALDDLGWLARHVRHSHPQVRVAFDLADLSGYAYYSGARFAVYATDVGEALVRGGRYDEVGAVFGRNRPAVGLSLDLKALSSHGRPAAPWCAIRAPWGEDANLRAAVRRLREQGETVLCILPGHEHEAQEFHCDRELAPVGNQWVLRPL
jgi:ATP phosphoribosyltransferase regulatory subunit